VFLLGRIDERYEQQAAGLRAAFPDVYRGIRGKFWRQLRRALDEGRDRALSLAPPRAPSLRPAPAPRRRLARTPPAATAHQQAGTAGGGSTAAHAPGLTVVRD
jgi:hypothetical protein